MPRQLAGEASEAGERGPDSLGGLVDPWGPYAPRANQLAVGVLGNRVGPDSASSAPSPPVKFDRAEQLTLAAARAPASETGRDEVNALYESIRPLPPTARAAIPR